jgi:hypothetical protein
MSIATNETDKQVGTILESIQAVTPEVAEQAVMYYRVMDSVWIVILAVVVVVAALICRWCVKRGNSVEHTGSEGDLSAGALVSGIVSFVCSLVCVGFANDLIHSFIAPQHYAAECIIELGGKAFGN